MIITQPDTELEYEIQELYILAKHWLQDIAFAEDELHFFKTILNKYRGDVSSTKMVFKWEEFSGKIDAQDKFITGLKKAVPQFLKYLEPYVGDLKKGMDLNLLEKYNGLDDEIKQLFEAIKITKKELFAFAEIIISANIPN